MSAYSVLIPVSCVLCPPFYKCCHLRMFLSSDWVAGRAAGVVGCLVMPEYSLPAVTMVLELVKTGEVAIPTSLHYECQYLITELGLKNIVEEVVGVTEEMVKVVEVTEEMVEVVEEVLGLVEEEVEAEEEVEEEVEAEEVEEEVEASFKCDQCPKTVTTRRKLREHIRCCHQDPRNCTVCHKQFKSRRNLEKHKLIHEAPNHSCTVCAKKFRTKRQLYVHTQLKHSERQPPSPLACSLCPKIFLTYQGLARHTRIGHRERPTPRAAFIANYISRKKVKVVCRICGSSFMRRNTFNQHMRRVHTNQGWISGQGFLLRDCGEVMDTVECDMCQLKFADKKELTKHLQTKHAGEKVFPCSECSKKFKLKASVRKHRAACHRGLKFQCRGVVGGSLGCGKWFRWKVSLRRHLAKKVCEKPNEREFSSLGSRQKARRAGRMADSLLLQLNGLGKEERSRVVKAMVRKNPDILDNMDFNPLEMDDVLEVPSYPCFHLYSIFASHFFHLFPSCFFLAAFLL